MLIAMMMAAHTGAACHLVAPNASMESPKRPPPVECSCGRLCVDGGRLVSRCRSKNCFRVKVDPGPVPGESRACLSKFLPFMRLHRYDFHLDRSRCVAANSPAILASVVEKFGATDPSSNRGTCF